MRHNFWKYCNTSMITSSKVYTHFQGKNQLFYNPNINNLVSNLFLLKEKSYFLSANLLGKDFSDLPYYDSFNSKYKFTVSLYIYIYINI